MAVIVTSPPAGFDCECRRVDGDYPYDVVQVSVKSSDGVEFTTTVQPRHTPEEHWGQLGYPEHVLKASPTLTQVTRQLKAVLAWREVWVWNQSHEEEHFPFLKEVAESGTRIFAVQDLMLRAAPYLGSWNSYFGGWQWPKMTSAAAAFGLTYDSPGPHDAASDASMLLKIGRFLERTDLVWTYPAENRELYLVEDQSDLRPF